MTPAADVPSRPAPRRLPPVVRRLLRSQQFGLVAVIVLSAGRAVAARRLARRRRDRQHGQQLPQLAHADPDRDRRQLLRDHGGRRDDRDHLGRHRPVGRVGLRAGGRARWASPCAAAAPAGGAGDVLLAFGVCVAVGVAAGALNGAMVVGLRVHPFIITLGTMWILRGIAFVTSKAESILLPESLTRFAKSPLGLGAALYPVPMLCDAGRQRAGRDLSAADGHGAARLRARRQRRGEPLLRPAPGRASRSASTCSPG